MKIPALLRYFCSSCEVNLKVIDIRISTGNSIYFWSVNSHLTEKVDNTVLRQHVITFDSHIGNGKKETFILVR